MSRFFSGSVWDWDIPTLLNLLLVIGFLVLEFLTSQYSPILSWRGEMVTDHWRPVFHAAPVTWWIALGLWLWLGPHFLWPAAEEALRRTVGG